MIVRTLQTFARSRWPVYIAGKGSFSPEVDAALAAPLLVDRSAPQGPLHALLSAAALIPADRIYAVGGDQVGLRVADLERVAAAWQSGDDAVVPRHSGGIESLGALYDRRALLRHASLLRRGARSALRDLLACLAVRFVEVEERRFRSANRSADLTEMLTAQ